MRVLFISRCPPYPIHLGDRLILWHLAREFHARGFTLDLLALSQFETDWQEQGEYAQFFRHIELFSERKRSALMFARRLLQPFPQSSQDAWQSELWQAIEKRLSQEKYDVVHLFGGIQVYEFAHILKEQATVISPYESYSLYLKRAIAQNGGLFTRLSRFITRQYERFMFSPYGRTVVLSPEDKAELLGINPKLDIEVIPNGIDLNYFDSRQQERQDTTLLFVGNYEYPPNQDAALLLGREILPEIRRTMPEVRLQLVGNAPTAEILALQSEHIEVTGRVADIRPYYAQASIFVCPLRIGAGIKNKLLEALAMGIPVVASPLSIEGISAMPEEDLVLAESAAMPQTILRLLQDKALQKRLSVRGRPLIEQHYSWQTVAERYIKLYQSL